MDIIEKAAKAAYLAFWRNDGCKHDWDQVAKPAQSDWIAAVRAAVDTLLYDNDIKIDELTDGDRAEIRAWIKSLKRNPVPTVGVTREMMLKLKLHIIEVAANLGEDAQELKTRFVRWPLGPVAVCGMQVTIDDGPAGQKPVPPAGEADECSVVRSGE